MTIPEGINNYNWLRRCKDEKGFTEQELIQVINKYGYQSSFRQIGSIREDVKNSFSKSAQKILKKRKNQLQKKNDELLEKDEHINFMFPIMQEEYSFEIDFLKHAFPLKNFPRFTDVDFDAMAIGSCFAENISHMFSALGICCRHHSFPEDINSPIALMSILKAINQSGSDRYKHIDSIASSLITKNNQTKEDLEKYIFYERSRLDDLTFGLKSSKLIIITLGNTLEWEHTFDKENIYPDAAVSLACHNRRFTGVDSKALLKSRKRIHAPINIVINSLNEIITNIRKITSAEIVITISPIPIRGVKSNNENLSQSKSAIVENSISKSKIIVALDAALPKLGENKIYYFPAFEIANEVSLRIPMTGFGNDDSCTRHLDKNVVRAICEYFLWCLLKV